MDEPIREGLQEEEEEEAMNENNGDERNKGMRVNTTKQGRRIRMNKLN